MRWAASATFSAFLTFITISLVLGGLAVAAPAGAQTTTTSAALTPTPTLSGTPPPPPQSTAVPGGIGATRGSLVVGIEAPKAASQMHTDRDFLIVGYALDTSA